jgi:hypothetical protein
MREPRLTAELEDDDKMSPEEWTAKAMVELAVQLGVINDYYFPLISAAAMLDGKNTKQHLRCE